MRFCFCVGVLPALIACGGAVVDSPESDAGSSGDSRLVDSIAFDVRLLDSNTLDVSVSSPDSNAAACDAASNALLSLFPALVCTTIVRVSVGSKQVIGWQPVCGGPSIPDESAARSAFDAYRNQYAPQSNYRNIAGPSPFDEWVFYAPPGDFGGLAAVSARGGFIVFAADINWQSPSTIRYPLSFRPASELPAICERTQIPKVRGLAPNGPMPDSDVQAAFSAIETTPLVKTISRVQYLFDAVVVPVTGDGSPDSNEWVLMINSNWLD